jgi:hypothetical protein
MLTAIADCQAAVMADADTYRSVAAETLCLIGDNTWTPQLASRGGLSPLRTVWYLTRIESGPRLQNPLKVEVSPTEEGSFQVHSPILGVSGVGENLSAATQDLCDTIAALWEEFSGTPPDRLSPDAKAVLARLRTVIA